MHSNRMIVWPSILFGKSLSFAPFERIDKMIMTMMAAIRLSNANAKYAWHSLFVIWLSFPIALQTLFHEPSRWLRSRWWLKSSMTWLMAIYLRSRPTDFTFMTMPNAMKKPKQKRQLHHRNRIAKFCHNSAHRQRATNKSRLVNGRSHGCIYTICITIYWTISNNLWDVSGVRETICDSIFVAVALATRSACQTRTRRTTCESNWVSHNF